MEGNHFDDVVRHLSEPGSRRGALRLLAGALAVLAGGQVSASLAKAKKKKKGKKKKKRSDCTKACPNGFVRDKQTCECQCLPQPCPDGKLFNVDECRCTCPSGMRECRHGCVGRNECCPSDPPCPEDPKGCCYSPGVEVCTIDGCCPELNGLKACNNFCVDTTIDRRHCGDCNVACEDGETCVDGECVPECESGLTAQNVCCPAGEVPCGDSCCDGTCCGNECVDTQTDPTNCGACGSTCDERTETCFDGQCRDICSLNEVYTVACDDGEDYWCCPERSPVCCRLSGNPHCC